jgi:hypothetical protein
MTERTPDFSELVGDDASAEERARLEGVHQMLVTVGPLPELPLALQKAPVVEDQHDASVAFSFLPRRGGRILTIAAGFALLCLIIGYVVGNHRSGFKTDFSVAMKGTAAAPKAVGVIKVGNIDSAHNWPLELQVVGLKPLPTGSWYTLYLTKNKRPVESCGTFLVHAGTTTVRMNAPYDFRGYDGWVVTTSTHGGKPGPALLANYRLA